MVLLLFLVLGLAVGSFLNVVIIRLRSAESLGGRSACRMCHAMIHWYDNIPLLSFLALRGHCRQCQAPISWQYPLVEALTGMLFFLVGRYFFDLEDSKSWLETLWLLGIIALFVVIAVYDLLSMEIVATLLWVVLVWTLLFYGLSFNPDASFIWGREMMAIFGALIIGGLFLMLVLVSHESWMGWGDVWLGALAGLIVGLPAALFMMTLSFGLGALVGGVLLASGKRGMKSQLPFAPFLVLGTFLTIFLPRIVPEYTWAFFLFN